jgi:hypothetical protein
MTAAFFVALALSATVRTDRPRILLSNGSGRGTSVATFRNRCNVDAAYSARCTSALTSGGGTYPAINSAAGYVVNGTPSRCTTAYNDAMGAAGATAGSPDAHTFISDHARDMLQLAVVRDWCDPVLSQTQKDALETKIVEYADWYSGTRGGYALDVWHDDMNNVWNAVAIAGLVLKGTAQDAKAATYLQLADAQWKNVIIPALRYEGDFWHEGFTYIQPTLGSAITWATAWSIATDEDVFASSSDVWNGYLSMYAYLMRPDFHYAYFGDTTDNKQTVELFSRIWVDMLTAGAGSRLGQAISLDIKNASRGGYDYSGADAYLLALFFDATRSATQRSTLPTSRWLSPHAADVAVLRSGWGATDTWIYISCGDWFGSHQHSESGSFQIFKNAILTTSSGYYDNFETDHWQAYLSQHSVHANTLAIYEPTEFFPTTASINNASANVNEGGQRVLRRSRNGTAYPNPDLPTYLAHKTTPPFTETGDMKSFEFDACHSYVACDVTAAYDSPGFTTNGNIAKVSEVSRQFVFLPPDIFVVFDRVESTNASYEKRFLLHTPASPVVNGNDYTLTNGGSSLFARTLLPSSAAVSLISNFSINGVAHPPNPAGAESFGTRLEIKPPAAATRDYFLHVFATAGSAPTGTLSAQDASSATATITRGTSTWNVTFSKTGALGGSISGSGCDRTLGGGMSVDAGTGGGSGGGSGGAGGSSGGAGGSSGGAGGSSGGAGGSSGGAGGSAGGGGGGVTGSACGCSSSAMLVPLLAIALRRTRKKFAAR